VERHGQEGIERRVGLGVSVDVAIRVLESKSIGIGSGDEKRSFVDGDVMGIAEREHPLRVVTATVRAGVEMMDFDEMGMPTTWSGTPAMVPAKDRAPDAWRDRLRGGRGLFLINGPKMLGVAKSLFESRLFDNDIVRACLLGCDLAAVTDRDRDLIRAQAFFPFAFAQKASNEGRHKLVVGDRALLFLHELLSHFLHEPPRGG
jgi:hypothetical protein